MTVILNKDEPYKNIKEKIDTVCNKLKEEKRAKKAEILNATAGKIIFDKSKSPLEIQKQLRDEWL